MIEVLSKPAGQIGISDIISLIDSEVPEGEQVEFKESLSTKGGSNDPWMVGKNKIGDQAKDALLKEAVGFANAYGGAVLLGIGESEAKPPVAARIVPIRRSDRCEEMSMREIQDMTLNVSRGLERLERRLSERAERFRQEEFECLETPKDAWGVRLTAAPVGDEIRIDRVFRQSGLAEEFNEPWHKVFYRQGDNERPLRGLGQNGFGFPHYWQPRLRAARAELDSDPAGNALGNGYRELHCDGLIELGYVSVRNYPGGEKLRPAPLPPDLPVDMFANLAIWADHIRRQVLAPTAEYALEVEMIAIGGPVVVPSHNPYNPPTFQPGSTTFPQYSLGDPDEIPDLLISFYRDFWNFLRKDVGAEDGMFSIQD